MGTVPIPLVRISTSYQACWSAERVFTSSGSEAYCDTNRSISKSGVGLLPMGKLNVVRIVRGDSVSLAGVCGNCFHFD